MTQGEFLLIHYSYGRTDKTPGLTLHKTTTDTFEQFLPRGETLTLTFDTAERFCTGWHDLTTSESFPCPDNTALPNQFDHCRHCQNKTGFNPAFYHATSVSPQQQARNAQPHFLYLAHFGPGVIKVGISWAERDISRLLDQGARSGLVVKTYPTATIARQYEAKAAALQGIAETLQVKAKHKLWALPYDAALGAQELLAAQQRLVKECGVTPDTNEPVFLDVHYFAGGVLANPIILHDQKISGHCVGMVGSTLITQQDGQQFGLNMSDFTGYRMHIERREEANSYQPQQARLF